MAKQGGGIVARTITQSVTDRLREEVRDGSLPPGARLRQAHLADQYGVSTTPVREAFASLEREGLVQSSAHRGVCVFEPTTADLREIYEIRIPLETLATEHAVPNLTEADLAGLAKLLERMVAADRKHDFARSGELNTEFHVRLYTASGRHRLTDLIAELRASSRAYTRLFELWSSGSRRPRLSTRRSMTPALARKPKVAGKAIAGHLQHTVDLVSDNLEEESAASCSDRGSARRTQGS